MGENIQEIHDMSIDNKINVDTKEIGVNAIIWMEFAHNREIANWKALIVINNMV